MYIQILNGNTQLAVAVLLGLWVGRSTTIADYGSKIRLDIFGSLIELGINTKFRVNLFWFFLLVVSGWLGVTVTSMMAFFIADRIGEGSIHFAKERYLPLNTEIDPLPDIPPVSLFEHHSD